MGRLPDLAPLYFGDMLCSQCGTVMKKTFEQGRVGKVASVTYTCINEKTGCCYEIVSDQRSSAMQRVVATV